MREAKEPQKQSPSCPCLGREKVEAAEGQGLKVSRCPRWPRGLKGNFYRPQIRTLRLKILAEAAAEGVPVRGARNQLRMYLTMAVAAAQPLLMYWLTFHLVR